MSNLTPEEVNKADLKPKFPDLKGILTLNSKCVKNCYPMQIYLKKTIMQ